MVTIEALYDPGTAEHQEDGHIVNPPFFGVLDALSPVHSREIPLRYFGKLTPGEMVKRKILETLYAANPELSLRGVVLEANERIRDFHIEQGIPLEESGRMAGATFAFAKINPGNTIKIIQGGDCFAVWITRSGDSEEIDFTENQVYQHQIECRRHVELLMRKYNEDREKMWIEFAPTLSNLRRRDYNQKKETGFAVLNGQHGIVDCWQEKEIALESLVFLALFSDGFVELKKTANEESLVSLTWDLRELYLDHNMGPRGILEITRRAEKKKEHLSHVRQAEATVMFLTP